jgi:hypothetical protein
MNRMLLIVFLTNIMLTICLCIVFVLAVAILPKFRPQKMQMFLLKNRAR